MHFDINEFEEIENAYDTGSMFQGRKRMGDPETIYLGSRKAMFYLYTTDLYEDR